MKAPLLEELEDQMAKLPDGVVKHDLQAGFEAMADWIQALERNRRVQLLTELQAVWLKEAHPWHSRAVMEIAVQLKDGHLLAAAIREARTRGVHDLSGGEPYPPWLIFQLDLLSSISRWPGEPGAGARAYLSELRSGTSSLSHSRRLLAIRALFTECLLVEPERRTPCLREGLADLRKWQDARLLRSGLSLLHAYFASSPQGIVDLQEVLTSEEFAIACPELVGR